MAKYGILKSNVNTGSDGDLIAVFTAPLSIVSKKPTLINETLTLKVKSAFSEVQRWDLTAGLMPLTDSSEMLVHSVINGYTEKFYVRMPQIYRKSNLSNSFLPLVFNDKASGETTINVTGLGSQILPVGEFIKFGGHGKIYMIKSSTRLGSNVNQVSLFPKLVKSVSLNEPIFYGSKVTMAARYGEETQIGISYTDGILAQYDNISLTEVL